MGFYEFQNSVWQNTARQQKQQGIERPSSMGQASGPSPVQFMQGSPQVRAKTRSKDTAL